MNPYESPQTPPGSQPETKSPSRYPLWFIVLLLGVGMLFANMFLRMWWAGSAIPPAAPKLSDGNVLERHSLLTINRAPR